MSPSSVIQESEIPLPEMENVETFVGDATRDMPTLEQLEKRYIQIVMGKTGGKKDKAAHILGINRRTLYRKEHEYGLTENENHKNEQSDSGHDDDISDPTTE
jgi:DNA-binding NtrC family response regulator